MEKHGRHSGTKCQHGLLPNALRDREANKLPETAAASFFLCGPGSLLATDQKQGIKIAQNYLSDAQWCVQVLEGGGQTRQEDPSSM